MPVYSVNQDQTTIGEFLRQPTLSPQIQNADTLVPALLDCQGVVHYTRSGSRTVVSDESMNIQRGDFLSVAEVCGTGDSQTFVAAIQSSDYAFVMPRDSFGTNAENYMNRRPDTRTVVSSTAMNSLDAILSTLVSGTSISTPINDILIVSHANAGGFLFIKLRNNSPSNQISYYELEEYLNDQTRPQMNSRLIRNNGTVHIRGCNIGKKPSYLNLIKQLFGNSAAVTAPKHLDNFSFFSSGSTIHRYEHLSYHFIVYNKTAYSNKQQVIDAFVNHSPSFADIFGNSITQTQYTGWIPQNINSNSTATHPCSNPIDSSLTVSREFRHRQDNPLYTFDIVLDSEPPDNQRINILKNSLRQVDTMKSSHTFPEYEQFGYSSLDEFVDNLNWNFNWNNSTTTLHCRGSRHSYELRIPITDENNNLFINALLNNGTKQYVHQQIIETDSRFFATV